VAVGDDVPRCFDGRELARFNPRESKGLVTGGWKNIGLDSMENCGHFGGGLGVRGWVLDLW
jgi:hypothetical protein